jgi:hypothetical protein
MATMRRAESKTVMGQQRASFRQGARHKQFIGANIGATSGRQAELAKVRELQEIQRAHATEPKPISELVADLVGDSIRLARTLVAFPFRLAMALRGRRASNA